MAFDLTVNADTKTEGASSIQVSVSPAGRGVVLLQDDRNDDVHYCDVVFMSWKQLGELLPVLDVLLTAHEEGE